MLDKNEVRVILQRLAFGCSVQLSLFEDLKLQIKAVIKVSYSQNVNLFEKCTGASANNAGVPSEYFSPDGLKSLELR